MLSHIHVRNFAIVTQLELDFGAGLTVLTGETGAGKSILLDALGLALGDRAASELIRHGEDRAEISVGFDVAGVPEAKAWLAERELEADGECIIRRTINRSGPSKAYINGQPSPVQALRELGEMLVDLHGQHEHQSLLKRDVQRQLLDDYAGHGELLGRLAGVYRQWKAQREELERLSGAKADREARLELLRFQVGELEALDLGADELAELDREHARLANASRLVEGGQRALQALYEADDASVSSLLGHCMGELEELGRLDADLAPAAQLLGEATIQIREAVSELRHYLDRLDIDPERLAWVEQRLAAIHELARKHRLGPEELPGLLPRLSEELAELEEADIRLERLESEIERLAGQYRELADQLGKGRKQAAAKLAKAVTERMQELGMEGGRFDIALEPQAEGRFSAHGLERVEYIVSANAGQPLKPLSKVASGGELSRIGLAILVITAQNARIPTLVFDEVDVGIGGRVAEIVGLQLRSLGGARQVVCVTHLPQVAALGHHHLQVSKESAKQTTLTRITPLSEQERVDEVARMLGGIEITDQTLSHAREMIERAQVN